MPPRSPPSWSLIPRCLFYLRDRTAAAVVLDSFFPGADSISGGCELRDLNPTCTYVLLSIYYCTWPGTLLVADLLRTQKDLALLVRSEVIGEDGLWLFCVIGAVWSRLEMVQPPLLA